MVKYTQSWSHVHIYVTSILVYNLQSFHVFTLGSSQEFHHNCAYFITALSPVLQDIYITLPSPFINYTAKIIKYNCYA